MRLLGHVTYFKFWEPVYISTMSKVKYFKFDMQIDGNAYKVGQNVHGLRQGTYFKNFWTSSIAMGNVTYF